jgi:serine/threonine-protein kinase
VDIRSGAPTATPTVTRPPHVALPELRPVEDTVRGALVEDTVQGDSQVETIDAAPAERTAVTPAPHGRQEVEAVDVERERLQRIARLGRLKRFRLDRVLGSGGMATVYLAHDRQRGGAPVAVKLLAAHLQDDPVAVGRFRREVRTLMALHHRHIAALIDGDAEAEGGTCWLACRYLDGGTLRELLTRTGPLPTRAALPIAGAVLEAEAYAHAVGVVHRDLKPQNILLGTDGSLCIADFGIASAVGDAPLTRAGTRFGTPAYMSPEQALGGDIDNRSDLFSTGAILFELLSGQSPFVRATALDTMRAVAAGDAAPLPATIVMPDAVRELLDALLQVDRDRRPPDAEAALRMLRPLLAHCPPVDEVVKSLLADPQAFAGGDAFEEPTVAGEAIGDARLGEVLTGSTEDIETLAAGFDDDLPRPSHPPAAADPLPAPPPSVAGPPPASASPLTTPPAQPPESAPLRDGLRAGVIGFSVALLAGAVILAVAWLSR